MVAISSGQVIGHVAFSPVTVGGRHAALALAPVAVAPGFQNKGVGRALIRWALDECRISGHKVVIVLGDPKYYRRFGFVPAANFSIECQFPTPPEHFMVLELTPEAAREMTGVVEYQKHITQSETHSRQPALMSASPSPKTLALGLIGAVIGGCAGYFAFFWIAKQGFYALVLPGGLLGLVAGLCARQRSQVLGILCGIGGLGLGLYTEWRFAPFIADESMRYFLTHVHQLKPLTLVMLALGTFVSYWLALGRDRVATQQA